MGLGLSLADALEKLPAGPEIHIHFHDLDYIDHSCLEVLSNWEQQRVKKGGVVIIEWDELMLKFHEKNRVKSMAA